MNKSYMEGPDGCIYVVDARQVMSGEYVRHLWLPALGPGVCTVWQTLVDWQGRISLLALSEHCKMGVPTVRKHVQMLAGMGWLTMNEPTQKRRGAWKSHDFTLVPAMTLVVPAAYAERPREVSRARGWIAPYDGTTDLPDFTARLAAALRDGLPPPCIDDNAGADYDLDAVNALIADVLGSRLQPVAPPVRGTHAWGPAAYTPRTDRTHHGRANQNDPHDSGIYTCLVHSMHDSESESESSESSRATLVKPGVDSDREAALAGMHGSRHGRANQNDPRDSGIYTCLVHSMHDSESESESSESSRATLVKPCVDSDREAALAGMHGARTTRDATHALLAHAVVSTQPAAGRTPPSHGPHARSTNPSLAPLADRRFATVQTGLASSVASDRPAATTPPATTRTPDLRRAGRKHGTATQTALPMGEALTPPRPAAAARTRPPEQTQIKTAWFALHERVRGSTAPQIAIPQGSRAWAILWNTCTRHADEVARIMQHGAHNAIPSTLEQLFAACYDHLHRSSYMRRRLPDEPLPFPYFMACFVAWYPRMVARTARAASFPTAAIMVPFRARSRAGNTTPSYRPELTAERLALIQAKTPVTASAPAFVADVLQPTRPFAALPERVDETPLERWKRLNP